MLHYKQQILLKSGCYWGSVSPREDKQTMSGTFTSTVYKFMPGRNAYSSIPSFTALCALSQGVVPMSGTIVVVVEDDGTTWSHQSMNGSEKTCHLAMPCTLCLLLSSLPFSSHRKSVHATRSTRLRKKSFSFKEYHWDERGLGSGMRRTIWFSAQSNIKWEVSKYFSNCTPKSINSLPQTAQRLENKMVLPQIAR